MASIVSVGFGSSDTVVLASGSNFPDALSASALAGAYGAPVVLTSPEALSSQARTTISSLGASRVIVMGGEAAVSTSVETEFESRGISVERVAGQTRQETSLAALSKVGENAGSIDIVIIASGTGFADSLSASPYSYAKKAPVVLAEGDGTLSAESVSAIAASGAKRAVIVGGTAVVGEQAASALASAGLSVERWSGADRYATSAEIAGHELAEGMSAATCAVATGRNFPDALAGGALVGSKGGVLLLADDGHAETIDRVIAPNRSAVRQCYMLGGTSAVPASLAGSVRTALGY